MAIFIVHCKTPKNILKNRWSNSKMLLKLFLIKMRVITEIIQHNRIECTLAIILNYTTFFLLLSPLHSTSSSSWPLSSDMRRVKFEIMVAAFNCNKTKPLKKKSVVTAWWFCVDKLMWPIFLASNICRLFTQPKKKRYKDLYMTARLNRY